LVGIESGSKLYRTKSESQKTGEEEMPCLACLQRKGGKGGWYPFFKSKKKLYKGWGSGLSAASRKKKKHRGSKFVLGGIQFKVLRTRKNERTQSKDDTPFQHVHPLSGGKYKPTREVPGFKENKPEGKGNALQKLGKVCGDHRGGATAGRD